MAASFWPPGIRRWGVPAVAGGLVLYAYGPVLAGMARRWGSNPHYSHGYLVPLFALALLWLRRGQRPRAAGAGGWVGASVLGAGLALHLAGAYFHFDFLAEASLLPALAGLCLCLGGWPALRWAWPSVAFLGFMLPLPYRLEMALAFPLRRLATLASTYLLQTMGLSAAAEGNVIVLEGATVGIVEACNGLGMLVTFFALATGVVLVVRRPWVDRAALLLSAAPVALAANVARITATAVVARLAGQELAEGLFHDVAGWLMMPLALLLLGAELFLLSRLLVEPPPEPATGVDFAGSFGAAVARAQPGGLPVGTAPGR
jgi:exosortase